MSTPWRVPHGGERGGVCKAKERSKRDDTSYPGSLSPTVEEKLLPARSTIATCVQVTRLWLYSSCPRAGLYRLSGLGFTEES